MPRHAHHHIDHDNRRHRRRRRLLPAAACLLAAGCAMAPRTAPGPEAAGAAPEIAVPLFEAGDAVVEPWRRFTIWGVSDWGLVAEDGEVVIRAAAEGASAGIARRVEIDPETCPVVEWSWRVERLPEEADLAVKATEDVAASLILAFGDPGVFANPDPVPTLRYVWATAANPVDAVIDSPYFPGVLRSVVVRSGPGGAQGWVTERRNIVADFTAAFGAPPDSGIEILALFTDSDHGGTPVAARYRWARALCTEAPAPPSIF
ncbi:DUF3047 domain-containing protein [Paralimibaculum aggregatum]|uniref:DUF3047 domain-containing protein n=1 Tax=Paralimibaculum aggregatum TaxID=3036245 RepID=A0ABQ6LJ33_9RHOB|nr:DUF3047 domain-containing protein [Limibaculum sp. NKW23]GMG82992.1 DUF3047 domain-containing protein [Limibaculum sp. NKW23]